MWVKSPLNVVAESVLVIKDSLSHSYWVSINKSVARRSRKHLFPLPSYPNCCDKQETTAVPLALESCGGGRNNIIIVSNNTSDSVHSSGTTCSDASIITFLVNF